MSTIKSSVSETPKNFTNCTENVSCEYQYWSNKGQSYDGNSFRNTFHSIGTYKWSYPSVYEGHFFANYKEGYAVVSLPNNSNFEGLFIKNKAFGPGILTYSNGRQDVGFWIGEKLVRLGRPVDFIIPRLAANVAAKIKLLKYKRLIPIEEETYDYQNEILKNGRNESNCISNAYSTFIYDSRSLFFDTSTYEMTYFSNCNSKNLTSNAMGQLDEIPEIKHDEYENLFQNKKNKESTFPTDPCLCRDDLSLMNIKNDTDICYDTTSFEEIDGILGYYTKYKTLPGLENDFSYGESIDFDDDLKPEIIEIKGSENKKFPPHLVSWNSGELCTEMLKQIFRFRAFEEKLNFKIAELMIGFRTEYRRTGEKERQCLHFLKMCSIGPAYIIQELLCNYKVSQDLMDGRGNNGVMFAAAMDQLDVIDILADYGVDVNAFNDENLTPLNLCLLRRLACTHGIKNWEKAFLLDESIKELDEIKEEWKDKSSVKSLDRIFGDGMSISDAKSLRALPSVTLVTEKPSISEAQITVLNLRSALDTNVKPQNICFENSSQQPGSVDPTPDIIFKFVPNSIKAEEYLKSIDQSSKDSYLFDLSVKAIEPKTKDKKKSTKEDKKNIEIKESEEVVYYCDPTKIAEINKTIEKLLHRGADVNLSDVPKPTIHLAIFTDDINIVEIILRYGANPNRTTRSSEGLLTPLHVLALRKPKIQNVEILKILLKFGADPEEETMPNFSFNAEEKTFLSDTYGRTPLQLICMRPDLEYGDPYEYIIQMGGILAAVCNKKHFYKGYTYLTLAMMFGNIRLLRELLKLNCFDTNEMLGQDLGTALHVLVSTSLQVKTLYENSIKMCDLLLEAGANPLLKFTSPPSLAGNCVDYGYRQIEEEKAKRKLSGADKNKSGKGSAKSDKGVRDHLKDHIRVVEYLGKRASEFGKSKVNQSNYNNKNQSNELKKGKGDKDSGRGGKTDIDSESQKTGIKSAGTADSSKNLMDKSDRSGDTGKDSNTTKRNNLGENDDVEKSKKTKAQRKIKGKKGKKKKFHYDYDYSCYETPEMKPKESQKKDIEILKPCDDGLDRRKKDCEKISRRQESRQLGPCKSGPHERSEMFSEALRRSLFQMYGKCEEVDFNKFLLPYVVLRDGNLYYRFEGKSQSQKEQYSLI